MMLELLISIAIMTTITTIVLTSNSQMSSRLQVDNLAHLIALVIRESQVKSLSTLVNANGLFDAYGVYFSSQLVGDANQRQFVVYVDANGDSQYQAGESISVKQLGGGMTVDSLEAIVAGTPQAVSTMSIVFRRPRTDAIIRVDGATVATTGDITIRTQGGAAKIISVTSTGQISVR